MDIELPFVDADIAKKTQALLDGKTKPRRSLGRLEHLCCRLAAIRGEAEPAPLQKAVVVMAADHGVAVEGVSAYPQEVTRQMLLNFASGGAAINVLARRAGARLLVVDMGVVEPIDHPEIVRRRLGPGTASFVSGPAMTRDLAESGVRTGMALGHELADDGVTLLGIGEMGIGNTTSASALAAALTGTAPAEVTGPGTGIDEEARRRKVAVIESALAANAPDPNDALGTLAALGGFEIAGLCGVILGAAQRRVPLLLDGFIASAAALVAVRMASGARDFLLASHRSAEPGHQVVLRALGVRPLLELDLRLGEGTGAALAMPLCDAALAILHEMATFEGAGVTDTGR